MKDTSEKTSSEEKEHNPEIKGHGADADKSECENSSDTDKPEHENDSDTDKPEHENSLEISKMGFFGKIKAKRQLYDKNTEGMTSKERFNYIMYYYGGKIVLGIILLVCVISVAVTLYKNNRPLAISYAIINNSVYSQPNEDAFEEYMDFYNLDNSYRIDSNTGLTLDWTKAQSEATKDTGSSYAQFPTLCSNGYFDIVITDDIGLIYCYNSGLMQPVDNVLNPEIRDELSLKYGSKVTDTEAILKGSSQYFINISDTDFVKKLGLSYDKVYLCFPGNSDPSNTNSRRFVKFIFSLDSDI